MNSTSIGLKPVDSLWGYHFLGIQTTRPHFFCLPFNQWLAKWFCGLAASKWDVDEFTSLETHYKNTFMSCFWFLISFNFSFPGFIFCTSRERPPSGGRKGTWAGWSPNEEWSGVHAEGSSCLRGESVATEVEGGRRFFLGGKGWLGGLDSFF